MDKQGQQPHLPGMDAGVSRERLRGQPVSPRSVMFALGLDTNIRHPLGFVERNWPIDAETDFDDLMSDGYPDNFGNND
jgi:hypothetical protein